MKRKRNQNDESNNNVDKKLRYDEEVSNVNQSNAISELDNSLIEKKEEFVLTREIADNAILCDIAGNQWRIGAPVGKGSFGEIYLASNDTTSAVNVYNANYVTKIEPHSNGPLFVEIHCLLNVNKQNEIEDGEKNEEMEDKSKNISLLESPITGIPKYIASGSHFFNDIRYRFLIMPRYKADLHSITKSARLSRKHFLILASQIIDVLMHLHEKHYVHSDIKAQNIMIGQYHSSNYRHQQPLTNAYKKSLNNNGNKALNSSIQYSGANPLRSCRMEKGSHDKTHHSVYNEMVQSHYLRPGRSVTYSVDENSRSSHSRESESSDNSDDEDYELSARKKKTGSRRSANKSKRDRKNSKSPVKNAHATSNLPPPPPAFESVADDSSDHVYIIDYGLATKFVDTNGEHRPFCMDQRRAHDGTLEFTSRDAHFGAHSRRSDLECFGYNLIYWSQGYLPWKDERLKEQPEIVHRLKEIFMTDVKEMLKLFYGKDVPKYLGEFMNYVGQLEFDEEPDYAYLKGLFEKEFVKLGYKVSDMTLNLNEVREQCEPIDKNISEHDLMMASITDLKTVTKLGFLVSSSDSVDGVEVLVKPNESMSLNLSCKASPKNLRSKEKSTKGKKPKRQRKLTEKEIISEKIAKGKKLSIQEIATLDPEQIARDRAEKEYEKFDEKVYYQTPQRYKGNPTYAILEIENRIRNKHNGSANVSIVTANNNATEIEPIKGYTKPMMDVLKKQQMIVEQQMANGQGSPISTYQKRNREGLRNVIKATQKNITYQHEVKKSNKKNSRKGSRRGKEAIVVTPVKTKASRKIILDDEPETEPNFEEDEEIAPKQLRGRKRKLGRAIVMKSKRNVRTAIIQSEEESKVSTIMLQEEEVDDQEEEEKQPVVKTRGRKRIIKNNRAITRVIESTAPETEEDSVYYDIPGEGSNDGTREPSSDTEELRNQIEANNEEDDDDNESDNQPLQKRLRKRDFSASEENSNDGSASTVGANKRLRGRYYNDEDFEAYTDEASNISSISHVTKSSVSFKPRRARGGNSHDSGINTRNKLKSRSTSRSAAATENSEEDEEEGSEFDAESTDESDDQGLEFDQNLSKDEEENTDEEASQSSEIDDDDDDSIDIKYSPIKTRHARRRISCFNMKQIRGRRINELNVNDRNFRLVSTRG